MVLQILNKLLNKKAIILPSLFAAVSYSRMISTSKSLEIKKSSAQNCKLIDYLKNERGIIKTSRIEDAMKQVDRRDFVRQIDSVRAYADTPQTIRFNVTISAPHMHAYALEHLKDHLKPGKRILDVGSGSGILLAYANRMGVTKAVGIEHIGPLVEWSIENLSKNFKEELENKTIIVVEGDGRKGFKEEGPYDCIHIGAAADEIPPALIEQLAVGGVMMVPYGPHEGHQEVVLIRKDSSGKTTHQSLYGVRYVPLTSREAQCPSLYKK